MKTKTLLTMLFLAVATAASAQVEFFYTTFGRNVICRDKKLFWMDGDDDPCFNIVNYKKVGNKETFNLTPCEKGDSKYSVTITLKDNKASHIVMKSDITYSSDIELKTEKDGDRDLVTYFRKLAGYTTPSAASATPSAASALPGKSSVTQGATKEEVGGSAVKQTLGKVKGLFKKKNKTK